jgi:hypothetical protein
MSGHYLRCPDCGLWKAGTHLCRHRGSRRWGWRDVYLYWHPLWTFGFGRGVHD